MDTNCCKSDYENLWLYTIGLEVDFNMGDHFILWNELMWEISKQMNWVLVQKPNWTMKWGHVDDDQMLYGVREMNMLLNMLILEDWNNISEKQEKKGEWIT